MNIVKQFSFISITLLWLLYLTSYLFLKTKGIEIYAGILFLLGQAGLDLLIIYYALSLKNIVIEKKTKSIINLIALSFLFAFLADFPYNIIVNILQTKNISNLLDSIFDLPFLCFLILQFIIWLKITSVFIEKKKYWTNFYLHFPLIVLSITIFCIFIFAFPWKINLFTIIGGYQIADTIFELLGFIVATVCFAIARNFAIRIMTVGYLIIIASDFIIRAGVIANSMLQNSILEATWVLGLIYIAYGLFSLQHNEIAKDHTKWVYEINSIRAQCAFWAFIFCFLSLMIFAAVDYFFSFNIIFINYKNITNLPSVLIIFIIPIVLISYFFSNRLLAPLKKIESDIESFSKNIHRATAPEESHDIIEFRQLSSFIKRGLEAINEKKNAAQILTKAAVRVAHDIRSPLAVMEMSLNSLKKIVPEKELLILRESIQSVRDIANNLLMKYRQPDSINNNLPASEDNSNIARPILISSQIEAIASQKRQEWQEKPCDISVKIHEMAKSIWIVVAPSEIRRTLSNLLNNAYEALTQSSRHITLNLNQIENYLVLEIKDTGTGIPQDKLEKVLKGLSLKHAGGGLGLSGAKNLVESLGGRLLLQSQEDIGTEVILYFPIGEQPIWFPKTINLPNDAPVIILDDDNAMHTLWKHRLQHYSVNMLHFTHSQDAIAWYKENTPLCDQAIFLIDYELRNNSLNGLELLKLLDVKDRGYLITSHAEEISIQEQCKQLNIWLIPKILAGDIDLQF